MTILDMGEAKQLKTMKAVQAGGAGTFYCPTGWGLAIVKAAEVDGNNVTLMLKDGSARKVVADATVFFLPDVLE